MKSTLRSRGLNNLVRTQRLNLCLGSHVFSNEIE